MDNGYSVSGQPERRALGISVNSALCMCEKQTQQGSRSLNNNSDPDDLLIILLEKGCNFSDLCCVERAVMPVTRIGAEIRRLAGLEASWRSGNESVWESEIPFREALLARCAVSRRFNFILSVTRPSLRRE